MGKAAKPRCFHRINVEALPVHYRSKKKKAWMTSELFNQWLTRWNRQLKIRNRKVLLFIHNCAAHNLIGEYSNINIQFLPPNTTSILQPLDQGMIKSFKTHYRRHLVNKLSAAIDRNDNNLKMSILEAINMLYTTWREVTPIEKLAL